MLSHMTASKLATLKVNRGHRQALYGGEVCKIFDCKNLRTNWYVRGKRQHLTNHRYVRK